MRPFFLLFKSEKKTDEEFETDQGGPEKQLTFLWPYPYSNKATNLLFLLQVQLTRITT